PGHGGGLRHLGPGPGKFQAEGRPRGVVGLWGGGGGRVRGVLRRFGGADVDTGLAIDGDRLFFSSMTTIYVAELGDSLVPDVIDVLVADLPESCCGHRTKPITLDGAGNLFTQVGEIGRASCRERVEVGGGGGWREEERRH